MFVHLSLYLPHSSPNLPGSSSAQPISDNTILDPADQPQTLQAAGVNMLVALPGAVPSLNGVCKGPPPLSAKRPSGVCV